MDGEQTGTTGRPWAALAWGIGPAILVAAVVAANVSGTVPMDSDEANHANLGLRQYQDLADGRLVDFVRHSYRTGQFPFFHGWQLLPGFAVLGTTLFAARVTQCFLFVLGAAATGWAAYRASRDDRNAGMAGAWLFALSPTLAAVSGLCMLEVPGAAWTAITLAVFAEACRCSGRRALVLHGVTALAALATYFTKLNYGLWVAPAIVAGHAVRLLDAETRKEALRHAGVYLGVLAVLAGLWYSRGEARAAFLGFLHNPPERIPVERDDPSFRVPGFSVRNFAEYVPILAGDFHLHWALGAPVLLAFVWGLFKSWRRPAVVAAAACLLWTWLVLSFGFREYTLARFIATALPALWIVAACGLAEVLRGRPLATGGRRVVSWALVGLLAGQLAILPQGLEREYEVGEEFRPTFAFVTASLEGPASVMVVNYTDHTSARTLVWELASAPGARYRDFDVKALIAERVFESATRFDAWMDDERPWGDERWASYVVEYVPGPGYLDRVVPETLTLWSEAVARYSDRLELVATGRFPELDVKVRVWKDRTPPTHRGP